MAHVRMLFVANCIMGNSSNLKQPFLVNERATGVTVFMYLLLLILTIVLGTRLVPPSVGVV